MNCPVCDDVRMREVLKDDVLIDVCPSCKGVWLDRGELDKLMKGVRDMEEDYGRMEQQIMSQQQYQQAPQPPQPQQQYQQQQPPQGYGNYNNQGGQPYPNQGYNSYGHGKDGYYKDGYYKDDKYRKGYPYKKKKSVFDVFGDLFD